MAGRPRRIGVVSYNKYGAFTNYGSALQSWALHHTISGFTNSDGSHPWSPILFDYTPQHLIGVDVRNPMQHMWDADAESREQCELTLPQILVNADKFDRFFHDHFETSAGKYFPDSLELEPEDADITSFVSGSDTVFCTSESNGFDPGFFADLPFMRNRSVAYAASFGDTKFTDGDFSTIKDRLANFKAIALRENEKLDLCMSLTDAPIQRVIDPTLLLQAPDYIPIVASQQHEPSYVLLYSRRYNPQMERFANDYAKAAGLALVEISLRAKNAHDHEMRYDAGVEEFLSLVNGADYIVTNSFHAIIFATQFRVPFHCFTRELAGGKIVELLDLLGLSERLVVNAADVKPGPIDFDTVYSRLVKPRELSLSFLKHSLELVAGGEA